MNDLTIRPPLRLLTVEH